VHELQIYNTQATKIIFHTTLKKGGKSACTVQKTAICSWRRLFPSAKIIVYGKFGKLRQWLQAKNLQIKHLPQRKNGKAKVSDIFKQIPPCEDIINIFINSDIILDRSANSCLEKLKKLDSPWLASGRRTCLPEWQGSALLGEKLNKKLKRLMPKARWGMSFSLDVFIFRGVNFQTMPDFYVGHCGWDNWIIFYCRTKNIRVIDASEKLKIYHFDHFNSKSPQGKKLYIRDQEYEKLNLKQFQSLDHVFHIGHATHILSKSGLEKTKGFNYGVRKLQVIALKSKVFNLIFFILRRTCHQIWKKFINHATEIENWSHKSCKS
jgi:hypothetical protein